MRLVMAEPSRIAHANDIGDHLRNNHGLGRSEKTSIRVVR